MGENEKKILQMLADKKISVDEAQRLLSLIGSSGNGNDAGSAGRGKSAPRFMHVIVEPKACAPEGDSERPRHGKVNIRVPLGLIRAGMKFATLMPPEAAEHVDKAFRDKGLSFDVRKIKEEDLQAVLVALEESEINVDNERETVRIYAE